MKSIQNVRGAQGLDDAEDLREAQPLTSRLPTLSKVAIHTKTQDTISFSAYISTQLPEEESSFQYQSLYAQDVRRQQPRP